MSIRTIFVDRDGVINQRASDHDYVKSWREFVFLPGARDALALLTDAGFDLFVVTNQRGVARGLLSEAELQDIHGRMIRELELSDVRIRGVYSCTHDTGQCRCRKPEVGLLLRAKADFPEIAFDSAAVVGDSLSDMWMATRIGCPGYLVADEVVRPGLVTEAATRRIAIAGTATSLYGVTAMYLLPR